MIYRTTFDTPYGTMRLGATGDGVLVEVSLPNRGPFTRAQSELPESTQSVFQSAFRQFAEYFAGSRREFDLPLEPRGSAFEKSVWQRLRTIPTKIG